MSRKYYNPPPWVSLNNVPQFIINRYIASYVQRMVQWSIKEYDDAIRNASERGEYQFVKYLTTEYSPMKILATWDAFSEMITVLSNTGPIRMSAKDRSFIRKSYQLFQAMKG